MAEGLKGIAKNTGINFASELKLEEVIGERQNLVRQVELMQAGHGSATVLPSTNQINTSKFNDTEAVIRMAWLGNS